MMNDDSYRYAMLAADLARDLKQRIERYVADVPAQVAATINMKRAMLGEDLAQFDADPTVDEILARHPEGTTPAHLTWMCDQIVANSKDWDIAKLHRWVGYIQGCLVHGGVSTLEEEKTVVREAKTKTSFSEG